MNKTNLYKQRMFDFVDTFSKIQVDQLDDKNQFNWQNGKVTILEYQDKVGNETKIVNKINNVLSEDNKLTLVAGLPSCGKTWLFANEIKKVSNEKVNNELIESGFAARKNINIFCVPNRNQAIQVASEYDLKRIVGGDELTIDTLKQNTNLVFVYDKLMELYKLLKNEYIVKDFVDDYKITIIVDEAHSIIQDMFRKKCIDVLVNTINLIKELGGNVVFTTASFEAMLPFHFDETICFFSNSNVNIPTTKITTKPQDMKDRDFISNEIAKLLKEDKVVYCRLQNKTLPDKIMKYVSEINEEDYTYIKINRDENDKGDNEAIASVIQESKLPFYNVYFCTSMIDAGTNIKEIENIGDKEIVPIFIYDSNNTNIDNIEQSFNRLRFNYKERKVLVCDSDYETREITLPDIIKEKKEEVEKDRIAMNYLYNYFKSYKQDPIAAVKSLFEQKDDSWNMSIKNLYFDEKKDSIEIDELDFFRMCRENIYMKQFLNPTLLQERLIKVLGGVIEFENAIDLGVRVEVEKVIEDDRYKDFKEMSTNAIQMKDFDSYKGEYFEKYKDTSIVEMYMIIRRKNNLIDTFNIFSTLSNKELGNMCREISKQELNELENNDRKALLELHNKRVPKFAYDKEKVAFVRSGMFKDYLVTLLDKTSDVNLTIKVIVNCANDNQIQKEILYLQSKEINSFYKKGLPAAGTFARKQYAFINTINEVKDGSSLSLYKDNCKKLELIIEKMKEKGYELKANEVLELSERIFKGREITKEVRKENKSGKIVVKKVKGFAIWELN